MNKKLKPIKKEILYNDITLYDSVGHNIKFFGKVHHQIFNKLITAKQNGKMKHMVTFLDDKDIISSNFPLYWQTYIKNVGIGSFGFINTMKYSEACAPYFLDYFGLDTAFNVLGYDELEDKVYSVNFLKPDEKLILLKDVLLYEFNFWYNDDVLSVMQVFNNTLKKFKNSNYFQGKNENEQKSICEKLTDEFAMSMLVRLYLLGDIDFSSRNYGLVVNEKTGEIKSAPNFDFEHSIKQNRYLESNNNLLNFAEKYPQIYEKFINKVRRLKMRKPFSQAPVYKSLIKMATDKKEIIAEFEGNILYNLNNLLDFDYCYRKRKGGVEKQ